MMPQHVGIDAARILALLADPNLSDDQFDKLTKRLEKIRAVR